MNCKETFIPRSNKDNDSLKINTGISTILKPWRQTKVDEDLPTIQVKELSRTVGASPEKVTTVLAKNPFTFSVNGSSFTASLKRPEFPNRRLNLADTRDFNLSPLQIIKAARYFSRKPGGGPAEKIRLTDKRIDAVIRTRASGKQKIIFERITNGAMSEPEVSSKKNKTAEEIIYKEPNGQEIMQVYNWFKAQGGKNWILGDENIFAKKLVRLAQGFEVNFLIWNCFGFTFKQEKPGDYPTATIINNLDTAIAYYFRDRIQKMIEQLARIGKPQVVILVPTNEALSDGLGIWKYAQSRSERETVIAQTLESFTFIESIAVSKDMKPILTMRWDDYLVKANAQSQNTYTAVGINTLRSLPDKEKRGRRALEQARLFFGQYGIVLNPTEEVKERQTNYLGMYAGEGVASQGNRIGDRDIVWINFEESNVKNSQLLGANGNLAVVTPATPDEINRYYRWKKDVIRSRDKNNEK